MFQNVFRQKFLDFIWKRRQEVRKVNVIIRALVGVRLVSGVRQTITEVCISLSYRAGMVNQNQAEYRTQNPLRTFVLLRQSSVCLAELFIIMKTEVDCDMTSSA